jgi:hypothetical protein
MAAVEITEQIAFGTNTGVTGPLRGLISTAANHGLSVQRYPADLGGNLDKNKKNHWVTFNIYDIQTAKYNQESTISIGQNTGLFGGAAAGVAAGITAATTSTTAIGAIVNTVASAGGVLIGTGLLTSGILKFSPTLTQIKSCISLYMPDTLNATYNASYEEMSLTKDLGQTVQTLRAIDSAVQSGTFDFSNLSGNNLGSDPGVIQAASNLLNNLGGGVNFQNLGTLLLKANGYALNPQVQMVYRGTGLRTFQLTFTFTPKSPEEAQTVNSIINQFRFYSSPSLGSNGGNPTDSMFLTPPSVFGIEFYVNGQESTVLPKYGKCVLTSIDVNDSPNGFSAYDDGSMVQRQVNLSFKELDMLTRDHFKGFGTTINSAGGSSEIDIRR